MNTSCRYIIHFGVIGLIIIFILVFISIIGGIKTEPRIAIIFICGIIIFTFLMSAFYINFMVKTVSIILPYTDKSHKEVILNSLDEFIKKYAKRNDVVVSDDKISYYAVSKYSRWLTEPITIKIKEHNINIQLPIAYKDKLKSFLNN